MSFIKNMLGRLFVPNENYPNDAIFVDIRNPEERVQGFIDGAVLLPLGEINDQANKLLPNKQEAIVLYCASGMRSIAAKKMMNKMGYENVFNGINADYVAKTTGKKIIKLT